MLPLKIIVGYRSSLGTKIKSIILEKGNTILIVGLVLAGKNSIIITPKTITTNKSLIVSSLCKRLIISILFQISFIGGLVLSYKKIKMHENSRDGFRLIKGKSDMKCEVCKKNFCEFIADPCNHFSLCVDCKKTAKKCPVCKETIINLVHVFA